MSEFDSIKYQNEFNKLNYDRITIMVPKGKKAEYQTICKDKGLSMNAFIISAINEKIKRDSETENA